MYSDHIKRPSAIKRWKWVGNLCLLFILEGAVADSGDTASAGDFFEEVTGQAGIRRFIPTAGAAWGDFNSDGWPDLWVGNHHLEPPSLFLNQGEGTFSDITKETFSGQLRADFHGASWADFDNDGDQDLLVLTGGGAGRGISQNYMFVNDNGRMVDRAKLLELDYPLGRGRTPLWLDVDRDGLLDVVIINKPRGQKAPSALFLRSEHVFQNRSQEYGFRYGNWTWSEKLRSFIHDAAQGRFSWLPGSISVNEGFAQVADLSGDGLVDLITYLNPTRVFSIDKKPFRNLTPSLGLPNLKGVSDVAIADFNGDGNLDLFLALQKASKSEIVQMDEFTIRGAIRAQGSPKGLVFRSKGKVMLELFTPWKDPTDPLRTKVPEVWLGALGGRTEEQTVLLSASDTNLRGPVSLEASKSREISVDYDKDNNQWTLTTVLPSLNIVLASTDRVTLIRTIGLSISTGADAPALLFQEDGTFVPSRLSTAEFSGTSCGSVVAADFDNDMAVDLYLACSGIAGNLPNRLYLNDGAGNFSLVPDAGGAAGTKLGIADSVTAVDFDHDGFIDLFVTNGAGPPPFAAEGPYQLFRNKGSNNHWLELDLEGTLSNRDGIGAQVKVKAGGIIQIRAQNGGMHYMSQNHQRLHFGLGEHEIADDIVIQWPSGTLQHLQNVKSDQVLRVREPQ